ncbi:MAG: DnaJ domain-containing protein [Cyclobacteriaceae bacterium]
MRDYYLQILGLTSDATDEEIRKAYRTKSKMYHPDVNKSEDAAELFHRIKEAYDYLTKEPELYQTFFREEEALSEREKWRIIARQRAKERAVEKARYQQELIRRMVKYFTPVAGVILLFNLLLALDFSLPYKNYEQKILGVSPVYVGRGEVYSYDDITFSDFTMRFKKGKLRLISQYKEGVVVATSLLKVPMKALIMIEGETLKYRQSYNIYYVFGYVIPPMLLTGLLFFRLKKHMHRLNAAIVIAIFSVYQVVIFLY